MFRFFFRFVAHRYKKFPDPKVKDTYARFYSLRGMVAFACAA